MGIKNGVESSRIASYVNYFFETHLKTHFSEEEAHVFPLLPQADEKRKKAERQHRKINRLVAKLSSEPQNVPTILGQIEEEVESHIRFEERTLFPYLQGALQELELEQLRKKIEEIHDMQPEKWADQFWMNKN